MLVMDLTSSQQTTGSNSRECRGWGDEINGNLIRFANKICKCNRRASVKISESDDNPNKLIIAVWTAGQQTCLQLLQEGFPKRPKLTTSLKRT